MPYKDPLKQAEYQKANYQDNKELWRQRQRNRRIENKAYLTEIKATGCSRCGYNKCPDALEFHHPDENKDFSVAESARLHSLKTLKKEVEKCILLCSNCHREEHWNLRNNIARV